MKKSVYSLVILALVLVVTSGCGGNEIKCNESDSVELFGLKWCKIYSDDTKNSSLGDFSENSPFYDEYIIEAKVFVTDQSGIQISSVYSVSKWALDTENCGSYIGSVISDYPANDGYPLDILILQVPAGCGETIEGTSTVFVSAPDYSPIYTNFSFTLTRSVRDENKLSASMSDLYFTLEPEVSNELETKTSEL